MTAVRGPRLGARGGLGVALALAVGPSAGLAQTLPGDYVARVAPHPYQGLSAPVAVTPPTADSGTAQVDLPFELTFFGTPYSTVYVNANGFVAFSFTRSGFNAPPESNPSLDGPNGFIAALWDDWCSASIICAGVSPPGAGVYYEVDPVRRAVRFEWRRVTHFRDDVVSSDVTFQLALFAGPTGRFEISFGPITPGRDAVGFPTELRPRVGFESTTGAEGAWLAPCGGPQPCSTPEAVLLTDQRVTVFADLGPELEVDGPRGPAAARAGLPLTAQVRLHNRHREEVGPFRFALHLLPSTETSTRGRAPIFESAPVTLSGYETRDVAVTVEVPGAVPDGEYRLAAVVDAASAVTESDEANNLALGESLIVAGRGPDFVAESVRPTADRRSTGAALGIAYRVGNFGNQPGPLRAQLYLSANPLITTADRPWGRPVEAAVLPRAAQTGTVTAVVEPDLPTGRYYAGLIADVDLAVAELDEGNNVVRSSEPVVIVSEDLAVLTTGLPRAAVGRAYAATLAAAGGDGRYAYTAVGLPSGLALVGATIEGTPAEAGAFRVGVTVASDGRTATTRLDVVVDAEDLPLTPVGGPLPEGAVGQDYSQGLQAIGGQPPYRWVVRSGRVPPGLTLDPDGTLAGVLREAGAFPLALEARDAAGAAARTSVTLTVRPPASLTILAAGQLPAATLNEPYSVALPAAGGIEPLAWSAVTVLPPGLAMTTTGQVSGIPEEVGRYTFRVRVRDAAGNTDLDTVRLEVRSDGRLVISPERLPPAQRDRPYVVSLQATGGRRPLEWTVDGRLPFGLLLGDPDPEAPDEADADAVLRGVSNEAGVWPVTVRVTDARGRVAERPYAIWVRPPPTVAEQTGCRCARRGRSEGGLAVLLLVLAAGWRPRRR